MFNNFIKEGRRDMAGLLNFYCQLFGYMSCGALGTFEALVLFGILAASCYVVLFVVLGITTVGLH